MKQVAPTSKKIVTSTQETKVPNDLEKALRVVPSIKAAWEDLTPISRRDFITWIEGAKQPETRTRRITIACDKLAKGERRPCCYAVVPMPLYKALGTNPQAKAMWSTLTPDERRDLSAFVDDSKQPNTKEERIQKVCSLLASNKRALPI